VAPLTEASTGVSFEVRACRFIQDLRQRASRSIESGLPALPSPWFAWNLCR
jgi:hypothetical protein